MVKQKVFMNRKFKRLLITSQMLVILSLLNKNILLPTVIRGVLYLKSWVDTAGKFMMSKASFM